MFGPGNAQMTRTNTATSPTKALPVSPPKQVPAALDLVAKSEPAAAQQASAAGTTAGAGAKFKVGAGAK